MNSAIIPAADNLTVILSAELEWRDDTRNGLDHLELRDRLARQLAIGELYSVLECRGAYRGTPEKSIVITGPAGRILAIARREAERFSQESVLVIDDKGDGELRFTNDWRRLAIGSFTPADSVEGLDAWTRVLATGETFTFR